MFVHNTLINEADTIISNQFGPIIKISKQPTKHLRRPKPLTNHQCDRFITFLSSCKKFGSGEQNWIQISKLPLSIIDCGITFRKLHIRHILQIVVSGVSQNWEDVSFVNYKKISIYLTRCSFITFIFWLFFVKNCLLTIH